MSKPRLSAIPTPRPDPEALTKTARALQEHVEVMKGARGDILDRAVTFRDLRTLGLITEDDLGKIERHDRLDN